MGWMCSVVGDSCRTEQLWGGVVSEELPSSMPSEKAGEEEASSSMCWRGAMSKSFGGADVSCGELGWENSYRPEGVAVDSPQGM